VISAASGNWRLNFSTCSRSSWEGARAIADQQQQMLPSGNFSFSGKNLGLELIELVTIEITAAS
jgi:hypothetical protein